jgi:hypothetical protein
MATPRVGQANLCKHDYVTKSANVKVTYGLAIEFIGKYRVDLALRLGSIFEEGAIAFTECAYSSLHRDDEFIV